MGVQVRGSPVNWVDRLGWPEWALTLAWLLLTFVVLPIAAARLPPPWERGLREVWLPLFAAAALVALARRSGLPRALLAALVCAALGFALETVALEAGTFRHRGPAGRWYAVEGWAAYEVSVLAFATSLCRGGRGRRAGCSATASLALGLASDPVGLVSGLWAYPGGGAYVDHLTAFDGSHGIPWWNFLSWAAIPAIASLAVVGPRVARLGVAVPWIALQLYFAVRVVQLGIWEALAASTGAAAAAVAIALLPVRTNRAPVATRERSSP